MSAAPVLPSSRARTPAVSSPSLHWSFEHGWSSVRESLSVEAPLALEIVYARAGVDVAKVLAITLRTPGDDAELAVGFLFAEGLIDSVDDVTANLAALENVRGEPLATQRVRLARPPREDLQRISRGLLTSSACGLCARPSLEGLPLRRVGRRAGESPLSAELIAGLPDLLRREQTAFFSTGGCHGAALCDASGSLHLAREDVGRHNAVDKLIGAALLRRLPLADQLLVLSGRASFELVQKAAAAGLPAIVAVGAPSSLAVDLAHAAGLTLVGFTRGGRFNVYTHADRLDLTPAPSPVGLARAG